MIASNALSPLNAGSALCRNHVWHNDKAFQWSVVHADLSMHGGFAVCPGDLVSDSRPQRPRRERQDFSRRYRLTATTWCHPPLNGQSVSRAVLRFPAFAPSVIWNGWLRRHLLRRTVRMVSYSTSPYGYEHHGIVMFYREIPACPGLSGSVFSRNK